MNRNLIISLILIIAGQVMAFLQLQGQFLVARLKDNVIIPIIIGIPVSYLLLKYTKYCALAFDGQIWPGRLIGFAVGAIVFTLMSWLLMKEPISVKTFVCLMLAVGILGIQIVWK
jgi:hypothetical protein